MKPAILATAASIMFASAHYSFADQFAIQLDGTMVQSLQSLRDALHIEEIDAFESEGHNFIVISAPNAAYVEAYMYAVSVTPVSVFTLEADWNGAGLSSLPVEARLAFMQAAPCEFCSGLGL